MRKKILSILLAAASVLGIASCDVESSNNGNFDGMWHITQFDTLSNGKICDMSLERRFWNVDTHLLQMRDYNEKANF